MLAPQWCGSSAALHPRQPRVVPEVRKVPRPVRAPPVAVSAALAASAAAARRGRWARRAAESPFEIKEVPSKGLGAVATRDIGEGELVVEERPSITFVDLPDWEGKIQEQFEMLPAKTQEALMELHDIDESKSLTGVFNTNSIGCYSESLDGSLCVVVSRFNHSCLPNCEQFWDDDMFRQKLFACRDISKGEELCFSYVEPFLSLAERQQIFRQRYAFHCRCPACTDRNAASDARRKRLGEVVQDLNRGVNKNGDAAVALAKEMEELCAEEGLALQGFRAQAAYHAFQCLLLARRPKEAKPWIRRARQQLQKTRGEDHPDVAVLRGYEQDPLSHPAATDEQIDWAPVAGLVVVASAIVLALQGQGAP